MSKGSKPSSPLHWDVREERAVKRYRVGHERFPERTRLALHGFAKFFGREDGDTVYAGQLAGILGDGNGWNAATTIRSFLSRGWIEERFDRRLCSWQRGYRITTDGLRMLAVLDELYKGERCPACKGETAVRHANRHFRAIPDDMCSTCEGTRLVRRAVPA
jgi:hypothetical protein